jgi:hypothetical protein
MSELFPEAKPGELSVREKAVETSPGVYTAKMRTRPVRFSGAVLSTHGDGANEAIDGPDFSQNYAAARIYLDAALEAVDQDRELTRAKQIARRDALLGHVAEVQTEIAAIDEQLDDHLDYTI